MKARLVTRKPEAERIGTMRLPNRRNTAPALSLILVAAAPAPHCAGRK